MRQRSRRGKENVATLAHDGTLLFFAREGLLKVHCKELWTKLVIFKYKHTVHTHVETRTVPPGGKHSAPVCCVSVQRPQRSAHAGLTGPRWVPARCGHVLWSCPVHCSETVTERNGYV